jgi:multidrug resistance efflux pump
MPVEDVWFARQKKGYRMTTPTDQKPESAEFPGFRIRTLVLAALALTGGIWLTQRLDQQRSPAFSGRLQARMTIISAEQAARLQEVRVKSGQRVSTGDELLVLQFDQHPLDASAQQQELARREQEARRIKAAADLELQWRRREVQAEIFQTQLKLAGLREEKAHREVEQIAWRERLSAPSLFSQQPGPAPIFQFVGNVADEASEERIKSMLREDAAAGAAQALLGQIELCEQRLGELRALDQQLETQIRASYGVDAAEEQVRQAAEQLSGDTAVTSAIVSSPGYGVVGQFRKQPGELVQAGEILVQILDEERRTIDVEVPSWAAVKFKLNQRVDLEFPGQEARTGIVTEIPPETQAFTDAAGDAPVRLTISPAGKVWPSSPVGSRVQVYEPR